MVNANFGDLFSKSINDYKKHFSLFIKLCLILVVLPNLILGTPIGFMQLNNPLDKAMIEFTNNIYNIVQSITAIILMIAIVKVLSHKKSVNDKEVSLQNAIKMGFNSMPQALVLSFLLGLLVLGLLLLFVIPGIIFSIFWVFAIYALINENLGIMESFSYSQKLVKGHWWKVFGIIFLQGLISIAVILGINFVFGLPLIIIGIISSNLIISILSLIISLLIMTGINILVMPFTYIFMDNFYEAMKADYEGNMQGNITTGSNGVQNLSPAQTTKNP